MDGAMLETDTVSKDLRDVLCLLFEPHGRLVAVEAQGPSDVT